MKSDIDIKDDIFRIVKGSALAEAVSGQVRKTLRPNESTAEDIVISVLANQNGEMQEAYVVVDIYVSDVIRNRQSEENTTRLRTLCDAAKDLFEIQVGGTFRVTLAEQRIYDVDGRQEHMIYNKLLYQQFNG